MSTDDRAGSPWLNVPMAAGYSTLSVATIERLVAAELLASSKVGGRRVIHRDDVDRYLRSQRTASNVRRIA